MNFCPTCNQPIPETEGAGRPRRYCNPVCRRLAESALRRLENMLERVERDLFDARHSNVPSPFDSWQPKDELIAELVAKRAALIAEIAHLLEMRGLDQ
jgi:hypothetical protein